MSGRSILGMAGAAALTALLLGCGPARADTPFCPDTVAPGTIALTGPPPAEPRAAARKACPNGYAVVTQQNCRAIDVEKQTTALVLRWVIRCVNFGGRP
jgi:hypothetical protein